LDKTTSAKASIGVTPPRDAEGRVDMDKTVERKANLAKQWTAKWEDYTRGTVDGFIASRLWYPFSHTHIITEVYPQWGVKDCENICTSKTDCCRWDLSAVRHWSHAKENTEGVTRLGWEIQQKTFATPLPAATWCLKKVCASALPANKFTVKEKTTTGANAATYIQLQVGAGAAQDIGLKKLFKVGETTFKFYMLMEISETNFTFFSKDGVEKKVIAKHDALKDLMEDPKNHDEVTFVNSWSCGQFVKDAMKSVIRSNSDNMGLLARCGGTDRPPGLYGESSGVASTHSIASASGVGLVSLLAIAAVTTTRYLRRTPDVEAETTLLEEPTSAE